MPADAFQNRVPAASPVLDRYFELAIYLLVCAGFGTLASTGGLDLPSLLLVGSALLARGYLFSQCRPFVISERWTTPLSLAYFAFFAADYFVFSRGFLPATIHLALFGVVVRLFSLRRERDYVTLAILAFLMVLASAVLTVDSVFLLSFAAFLLIAIVTFILMEMRRSARSANVQPKPSHVIKDHRRFAISLAQVSPALMLIILVLGAALFFLIPRMSAGYMGDYAFGTDLSTGFSDRVELGQIGRIQQSNAVAMHIRIEGDTSGRYDLHWRGVALSDFDGTTWSSPRGPQARFTLRRQPEGNFRIPQPNPPLRSSVTPTLPRENVIRYRVLMEAIGTNVVFLAPWARSVRGDYRIMAGDLAAAVYNIDNEHPLTAYEAESNIAKPSPEEMRTAGRNYPAYITARNLHVPPEIDSRIPQLALEITRSSTNDFDRAQAIETYLRTHFRYTLQLPPSVVKDPVADFLFHRKEGHCEYFSSAMAVMLRTLGIPARVVNGFRSNEFNDLTGSYVVRAKDAHSWVEAYFPGYGWQTFDPTPAGSVGTPQGWGRIALYLDAMASFWREWIVSYDSSHQYALGQNAIGRSRALWQGARHWARVHYQNMLNWARRSQDRVEHSPGRWTIVSVIAVLALALLANARRIFRWLHARWLVARPERSPEQAAAIWYQRMARVLARRGLEKSAAHTPQEFLKEISHQQLREPVARFTEVYEAARFGNSVEHARRLPELYAEVEAATRGR